MTKMTVVLGNECLKYSVTAKLAMAKVMPMDEQVINSLRDNFFCKNMAPSIEPRIRIQPTVSAAM